MAHDIILYGFGGTRSARCRWALLETGLDFEYVDDRTLIRSDWLRDRQPLAKLPVMVIDGEPLFESAAICTCVCDLAPQAGLIAAAGTRERALHDQWTSFVLTELEAYLWSNAKHASMYPEDKRVPAVIEPNREEARKALTVLDDVLGRHHYLVAGRFSVTDIIASWTVNWARRMGLLADYANLQPYLDRLFTREHCTLNRD